MSFLGKKKLYIGIILFVAVSVIGIIIEFILDKGGIIAIAGLALSFLVLAVFLGIEAISRHKEEKKALADEFPDDYGSEPLSGRRFLRYADEDDDIPEPEESFSAGDDIISQVEQQAPARRFFARNRNVEETEPAEESAQEPRDEDPDVFTPVMRIPAPGEEADPFDQEFDDDDISEDEQLITDEIESADEPQSAPEEPDEEPAKQEDEILSPPDVEVEPPTAQEGFVPVPIGFAQGQTLESFYADMGEDDILYRDCVEVWAADAKPAVLRLMKYVEGIEDKHTAALFGRECEYINAMIDRIQCFTQLEFVDESLELRKCNFATLVKDCLKRFSPFFMEKRLGLLWKGLDIDVITDRRWFIFALTQVIFNSVEFTPEGGKIAISAKREDNFVDLVVDDSGKGISPEEMPYIFVAGYMGDDSPNEAGRRTGMGLFIAKSVINKMGGDVFAESNPGKGTRITIRMPIIEEQ